MDKKEVYESLSLRVPSDENIDQSLIGWRVCREFYSTQMINYSTDTDFHSSLSKEFYDYL